MKGSKYILPFLTLVLITFGSIKGFAQSNKKNIVSGNKAYRNRSYKAAEKEYDEALKGDKFLEEAAFNKGDALYRQKKYAEATQQYLTAADKTKDKELKAKSLHNLGNSFMQQEDYEKALKAYQMSMMNNPNDEKTRHNLAYALQKLKKQKQDQKKDQNKQQQQQQQQPQQQKPEDQKKDQQQQQQQQQQESLNKQNAENMLDALNQDEKNIQKKVKGNKGNGKKSRSSKDW